MDIPWITCLYRYVDRSCLSGLFVFCKLSYLILVHCDTGRDLRYGCMIPSFLRID
jgi:hypothetical protein